MKKSILFAFLTGALIFSSCVQEIGSTDTWDCSVELRSEGAQTTTTKGGGICLVKGGKQGTTDSQNVGEGGDRLIVEVYSSHEELTVVSCDFDLLQGDQLSAAGLGKGAQIRVSNGVGTIIVEPALLANNITESRPCTFRITLQDSRSGQKREFVKEFYVYKNFWLNIAFKKINSEGTWTDAGTADDEHDVWGLQPFQYEIRSNQKTIIIKDFDWEANKFAVLNNALKKNMRLDLSWNPHDNYFYKTFEFGKEVIDFPKVTGTEGEGDKDKIVFWITAYNEDFDTAMEERTEIKWNRRYNTIVDAKLSTVSSWVENGAGRNILERNQPAHLLIYCNRNTSVQISGDDEPTITDVYSLPDITNPNLGGYCWFKDITTAAGETKTGQFSNGVKCYDLNSVNNILSDDVNPHPGNQYVYTNGILKLTLHTVKPVKEWPLSINYEVRDHVEVGPSEIVLSEFKCFDKAGNSLESTNFDPDNYHFNEGQFLAARITGVGTADGKVSARLLNTTDGTVDFCFVKSKNTGGNLQGTEVIDSTYSGYKNAISTNGTTIDCKELSGGEVWLVCRGLDRGGLANIKLEATVPMDEQGNFASASFSPFVRHRLAAFLFTQCSYHGEWGCLGTATTGDKFDNLQWGWTGWPDYVSMSLNMYKSKTESFPTNSDPLANNFSNINTITRTTPIDGFQNTSLLFGFDIVPVNSPRYTGPNNYDHHMLICDYEGSSAEWKCPYHKTTAHTATPDGSYYYYLKGDSNSNQLGCAELRDRLIYWNSACWTVKFLNFIQGGTTEFYVPSTSITFRAKGVTGLPNDYELRYWVNGPKCGNYLGDLPWWQNYGDGDYDHSAIVNKIE